MKIELTFFICASFLLCEVTAKHGSRIIGGTDARTGQFPFAAAIYVQTEDSRHFCGGALMRPQWVLTSATCIYNATLFTIQLGSTSLTTPDDNRLTVVSSEYIVHPEYNPLTLEADVGHYLHTAEFNVDSLPKATEVLVLGWGQTSDSDAGLSEHLQYVNTLALSIEECRLVYGNQVTDNMVCVEGNYNEGTCTGDNGSPLLQVFGGILYYVVGIASFVSGNGCESTDPSGYTRTTPYYYWIRDTMATM